SSRPHVVGTRQARDPQAEGGHEDHCDEDPVALSVRHGGRLLLRNGSPRKKLPARAGWSTRRVQMFFREGTGELPDPEYPPVRKGPSTGKIGDFPGNWVQFGARPRPPGCQWAAWRALHSSAASRTSP